MNVSHCLVCGFVFGQSISDNKASDYESNKLEQQNGQIASGQNVMGSDKAIESSVGDIVIREHCVRIPYKIKCMGNHHVCNFCLAMNIAQQHNSVPHEANPTPIVVICDICPKHKNTENHSPEPDLELFARCLKNNEKIQYEIERLMNREKTQEMIQSNRKKIDDCLNRFVFKCMGCDGNGCINTIENKSSDLINSSNQFQQQEQQQSNRLGTSSRMAVEPAITSLPRGSSTMSARGRLLSSFCHMPASTSSPVTSPPRSNRNGEFYENDGHRAVVASPTPSLIKPSLSMCSISSNQSVDTAKPANATIMCKDCRLICCDKCHKEKHDRMLMYNNIGNAINMICDSHGQVIKIYCYEHMEFICSECFIKDPKKGKHKFHHHIVFITQDEAHRLFTMYLKELRKQKTCSRELLGNVKSALETYSMDTRNNTMSELNHQHCYFNMRILDGQKNRLEQTLALVDEVVAHLEEFSANVTRFKFIDYDSRKSMLKKLPNVLSSYLELAKSCNKSVMTSLSDINETERNRSRGGAAMFEIYNKNRFIGISPSTQDLSMSLLTSTISNMSLRPSVCTASRKKPLIFDPQPNPQPPQVKVKQEEKPPLITAATANKPNVDTNNNIDLEKNLRSRSNQRSQTPETPETIGVTTTLNNRNKRDNSLSNKITDVCDDILEEGDYEAQPLRIVDPCEFYLSFRRHEKNRIRLRELLFKRLDSMSHLQEHEKNNLRVGDLYLCLQGNDAYRCRIESKLNRDNETVAVFFIDDGRQMNVDARHLRHLHEDLRRIPPLVVKCFLNNLKPYDSQIGDFECAEDALRRDIKLEYVWNDAAKKLLSDWIKNYPRFTVKIMSKIRDENWYGVDLIAENEPETTDKDRNALLLNLIKAFKIEKIRISDSFLSFNLAKNEFVQEQNKGRYYFRYPKIEVDKPKFLPMWMGLEVYFDADMGWYESINSFYLRNLDESTNFTQLNKQLHNEYATRFRNEANQMRVFMPREGMPVAALFSEDNKWYRGEIVRILPNTGQIEVFFVDYGNSDIMENTANIRYLLPEYLTLSVFTLRCRLFGIRFANEENRKKSQDVLLKYLNELDNSEDKTIKVHVKNIADTELESSGGAKQPINSMINRKTYEIIMRFPIEKKLTNINVLLTKMGLAECTAEAGTSIYDGEDIMTAAASVVTSLKKSAADVAVTGVSGKQTATVVVKKSPSSVSGAEAAAAAAANSGKSPAMALHHCQVRTREHLSFKLEKDVGDIINQPKKTLKQRPSNSLVCKVTCAISPGEIWLQDVVDAQEWYQKFQNELADYYKDLYTLDEMRQESWEPGDLCVLMKRKNIHDPNSFIQFYRAKVIKLNPNTGKYKLILLDAGIYDENVDPKCLLRLVDDYRSRPQFKAKRCRLTGIEPTGTSNGQWTSLACKYTMATLTDQYVHVVFERDKNRKTSLPAIDRAHIQEEDVQIYLKSQTESLNTEKTDKTLNEDYVRFVDLLNIKGLAFLQEKKVTLDKLMKRISSPSPTPSSRF